MTDPEILPEPEVQADERIRDQLMRILKPFHPSCDRWWVSASVCTPTVTGLPDRRRTH